MPSRLPHSRSPWEVQKFGHSCLDQAQFRAQPSLVFPLLHPDKALHQQMLVSELFKYVKEIRKLEHGYAFRFDHSDDLEDLLGKMAEYIVFESLNSSQLTFTINEEPKTKGFWLQVRN